MNRDEKSLLALTSFGHALNHSYLLIYPSVLLLLQREFSLGFLGLGIVGSTATLAYGLGALPGGVLCDWLGPKKLFLICFLGSAFCSLMIALSSSFFFFALWGTLLGAFGSVHHPTANVLLTSKVREMGRAVGIHGAVGNIGLALTPSIAAFIATRWGWRTVYWLAIVPGLCISAWALFVDMSLPKKEKKPAAEVPSSSSLWLLCTLPLVLLYMVNGFNGFCNTGVLTFLPAYVAEKTRFTFFSLDNVVIGGMLSSVILFLGVFGQYVGGVRSQGKNVEGAILIAAVISLPLALVMSISGNLLFLVAAFGYFFLNFAIQPMTNISLATYVPAGMRGTAFGIFFAIGFAMASATPAFSGYLAQRFGLSSLFFGISGGVLLMILSAFLLKRYAPRPRSV